MAPRKKNDEAPPAPEGQAFADLMQQIHNARHLGGTAWVAGNYAEPGVRVQYASRPVLSATNERQA